MAQGDAEDLRQLMREEWIAFDANMRRPAIALGSAALVAAMPVAALSPAIERWFGLSFPAMAAIFFPMVVSVLLATFTHQTFGFDSKIYRFCDHLETTSFQVGCGAASLYSRDPTPLFWLFHLVHAMVLGFHPYFGLTGHWIIIAVPAGVALVSWLNEGATARAFLAVVALVLGLLVRDLASGFRRRVSELSLGRTRAERALAELKVEAERARIARDLHDGLAADLTAIAWRAEVCAQSADNGGQEFLAIAQRARAAIDDTKVVVWALREDSIDWASFVGQLKGRCRDLCDQRVSLELEPQPNEERRLPGSMAVDLLRIAQESVRNVLQHAAATRIVVRLRSSEAIVLEVEDDGSGVSPKAVEAPRHYGLRNLERRAAEHGGAMHVLSSPTGTRVTVTLPWPGSGSGVGHG